MRTEAKKGHMTDPIKTMRQSDLMNRMVVDRDSLEEMGRVEVLWMYPPIHRVLGFVCKSGFLGNKKFAYRLAQIAEFKDNSILVHSPPDATDAERVRVLESLLQYEVWRADGDAADAAPQERIGKINDCLFKLKNGKIIHYLFVSNGLSGILGDIYQLPPAKILSINENRVLVAASVVPTLHLDREGIVQKLTDVKEFVREEAAFEWRSITRRANRITSGTKERFQEFTQQTQEFTQQTQERSQQFTQEAKERSQQFTQEAKEKVKVLDERLQEFPQDWVDRLRSKSQTVAEQVKQRTQNLSQQVEEGIGVVLEQTGEWGEGVRRQESEVGSEGVRSEGVRSEGVRSEEVDGQEDEAWGVGESEKQDSESQAIGQEVGQDEAVKPEDVKPEDVKREQDVWDDDEWDDVWGELTLDEKKLDRAQDASRSGLGNSEDAIDSRMAGDRLSDDEFEDDEFEDEFEEDDFENEFENESDNSFESDRENALDPSKNQNDAEHLNDEDDDEPWI
jgi:uncharacterized protein YrrD